MKLPDTDITPVERSDGSGTTFVFTDYLSKVSPEWKDKVGENTSVSWPTGIGGKGNEGVAANTGRTVGAIGYVEYAYALQTNMVSTKLINAAGKTLSPSTEVFQAAAANADWKNAPGFHLILTNQPGDQSWPITGASFILMHLQQEKPANAKQVLDFYDWSFKNGQKLAESLDYIPFPPNVVSVIETSWQQNIKDMSGKPVWTGPSS